jgi:hypothetical protein
MRMTTFKARLYDICDEVASEFQNWRFSSGAFKNKALGHSTMEINLGLSFRTGNTPLQPSILIKHKKSMALFKKLNGYEQPTSIVLFQNIAQLLEHMPNELRITATILADKNLHVSLAAPSEGSQKRLIDITQSRSALRAVMMDGIGLIGKLYNLSSEESFLQNLPPQYETRSDKIPYDEFEKNKGVMICIIRALCGDFDSIHEYRKDTYKTIFPKPTKEIDGLISALPELKRLY